MDIPILTAPSLLSLLLLLLSSLHLSLPLAPCNNTEKNILLIIRDWWGSSSPLPSWTSQTDCCRDWVGVHCDRNSGHVTGLVFPEDPAIGKIPPVIGDLVYLQVLYFHKMPNLYGTIPDELAKLTSLQHLTISQTGVYGSIPTFFANLSALQKLDLSGNRLSGSIPDSIFRDSLLPPYLDLSHNNLTGEIPLSFRDVRFSSIKLSTNNLAGDSSFLFGRSKPTQQIDLSRNQLPFDLTNVELPEEELSLLDLSYNKIYGRIPIQITKVENLRFLNVSYNSLCGEIPKGGRMGRFDESSYIHNNCLCGEPLPPCK